MCFSRKGIMFSDGNGQALERFTAEERSMLLRFVTGRRRLPATIRWATHYGDDPEQLPQAASCSMYATLPRHCDLSLSNASSSGSFICHHIDQLMKRMKSCELLSTTVSL